MTSFFSKLDGQDIEITYKLLGRDPETGIMSYGAEIEEVRDLNNKPVELSEKDWDRIQEEADNHANEPDDDSSEFDWYNPINYL